ncbi:MAG: DUF2892 domain-containing protein [Bryobacteraceae bacterium]
MNLLARNEGTADRIGRVILGIILLSLAFVGPQTPWGYIGVIPILTGVVGMCPLYRMFGLSTCPSKNCK